MPKTAIIFVHGFMGCHRQFDALADLLDDGETEMIFHVLPGHESSLADFRKTTAKDWQESVNEVVRKMSESYDRIVLVGHSMGGLLAVRAAVAVPEKVAGVACIGFPIKVSIGKRWFDLMGPAAKPYREGEDPRVTVARSMSGVTILSTGEYLSTLRQNLEFLKTPGRARRELHLLNAPLTVLNFEKDEIVSLKSRACVLKEKPDARVVMYPESYHFLFTENELYDMSEEIKKLL